jgi:hypothetical protein
VRHRRVLLALRRGLDSNVSVTSERLLRRITSATPTDFDGSLLSRSLPSSISTAEAAAPFSGEEASWFATVSNFALMASAAPCTAEPTLEVV